MKLTLGSRKSPLALAQTHLIQKKLGDIGYRDTNIIGMVTEGDQRLDKQLADIGGKGLFLKELDKALLDGQIDIAVHSTKDVPVETTEGLVMAAVPLREDANDIFVSNKYGSLEEMPKGATVGTCSLRRQVLLEHYYPQIKCVSMRGNIHTRLDKLDASKVDALLLAKAGFARMGLLNRVSQELCTEKFIPAVGQGALAIYCREDDLRTKAILDKLNDIDTRLCVDAERAVTQKIGGGCHMPIGVYATLDEENIHLKSVIGDPKKAELFIARATAKKADYESAATEIVEYFADKGAVNIIKNFHRK